MVDWTGRAVRRTAGESAVNTCSQGLRRVLVIIASMAASILGACAGRDGAWRADVTGEPPAVSEAGEVFYQPNRVDYTSRKIRITFEIIGQDSAITAVSSWLGDVLFSVYGIDEGSVFGIRDETGRFVELHWDNGDPGWPIGWSTLHPIHTVPITRIGRTSDGRTVARASVDYEGKLAAGQSYTFEWRPQALHGMRRTSLWPTGPIALVTDPIVKE